ncbi:hypothetical protein [Maridesulfovibrio bastinii]|uniref:capsular polysaccharide export protein, LipB/KpsS family n=1 Tax=Maridesulfovibrio bastinii TaxID=47157 RepID=UPI00146FA9B4|nr:hypothetical protein [Maridesulfovibrio bastinii]
MDSFNWIGRTLIKMIEDQFFIGGAQNAEIKILASKDAQKGLLKEFPGCDCLLSLSPEDENYVRKLNKKWNDDAIDIWRQLMRGEGDISNRYRAILEHIKYSTFDFQYIVYWGTNGAVQAFAKEHGIVPIAMEQGVTRTPFIESICMDPLGVNGESFTPLTDLDSVEPLPLSVLQRCAIADVSHGQEFDALYRPLTTKHAEDIMDGVGRNILIPLQLDDDANILEHSDVGNMLDFLQQVIPQLVKVGYRCLVKPHPGALFRDYNVVRHEMCRTYVENQKGAFWIDGIDNREDYLCLIGKSEAVVVVNSSLGFEAMLMGCPVIPFGKAPYVFKNSPLTFSDVLSKKINYESWQLHAEKVGTLLLFNYLIPKSKAFSYQFFCASVARCERIYNSRITVDEEITGVGHTEPINSINELYACNNGLPKVKAILEGEKTKRIDPGIPKALLELVFPRKNNEELSISHLLKLKGKELVVSGYWHILNRYPDPDGMANYLPQVRSGALAPASFLLRLRLSPEGRVFRKNCRGLLSAFITSALCHTFCRAKKDKESENL